MGHVKFDNSDDECGATPEKATDHSARKKSNHKAISEYADAKQIADAEAILKQFEDKFQKDPNWLKSVSKDKKKKEKNEIPVKDIKSSEPVRPKTENKNNKKLRHKNRDNRDSQINDDKKSSDESISKELVEHSISDAEKDCLRGKKRKSRVVADNDSAVGTVVPSKKNKTKPDLENYTSGGLSTLFGKNPVIVAEDNSTHTSVNDDESKLEKTDKTSSRITPKKVTFDEKTKTRDASESIGTSHGREKERENRKKKSMTQDEKKKTLFIGNAPLTMNERLVRAMFKEFGKIESVRIRSVVPSKLTLSKRVCHITGRVHEKQNSQTFYVKFSDEDAVEKALSKNGTILEGHRLRVDKCVGKQQYDRTTTVFVGNLPEDSTEDGLADLFDDAVGATSFVRIVRDNETGMCKGIAFVAFQSTASLEVALHTKGLMYENRELRITRIVKKSKVKKPTNKSVKTTAEKGPKQKNQSKIDKFKFSTKSTEKNERPRLKKTAMKAIRRKGNKGTKSLMA